MTFAEIHEGMKVHYTQPYSGNKQNGIVKRANLLTKSVFVVFNCDNQWHNYRDYTGQSTPIEDLTAGWI